MKKRSTLLAGLCFYLLTACGGATSEKDTVSEAMEVAADTTSAAYEAAMEAVEEDGKKLQDAMKELDALFSAE